MSNIVCMCGCNESIDIKSHHKYYGLPKFKRGHAFRGKTLSEERKQKMRGIPKIFTNRLCLDCSQQFIPKSSRSLWCITCSKNRRHKYLINKNKEIYWKDIEKTRYQKRKQAKERKRILRNKIITYLGKKCVRCGFDDYRALQIDHVNGGGNVERKIYWQTIQYYNHILTLLSTNKYQLLCANCNWIKREENNEIKGK